MRSLLDWIGGRLLPALVTAAGVALLMAGLLSYQDPPQAVALAPSAAPSASPGPCRQPPRRASRRSPRGRRRRRPRRRRAPRRPASRPGWSSPPCGSTSPSSGRPAIRTTSRTATSPSTSPSSSQPGSPGTTYLYAHAREGMFLPLLRTADAKMVGMLVQVYTSDNQLFLYEITRVMRHQDSLDFAFAGDRGAADPPDVGGAPGGRGRLHRPGDDGRGAAAQRRTGGPEGGEPVAKPVACE